MAVTERPSAYIPMDRRQALLRGVELPEYMQGAALFADISGFTPLTESLARELGHRRGAEELTRHLNIVYDGLITELHRFGGSVLTFSGDAITCWIDGDHGGRATACALAMQQFMNQFAAVKTPSGMIVSLAMKTAVVVGGVRRLLVGEPDIQILDVMAGKTLDRLAAAENLANRGEIILDSATVDALKDNIQIAEWRSDQASGDRFALLKGMTHQPDPSPWPQISPEAFGLNVLRKWLLPSVHERLRGGRGEFLAELRPAVALFLQFQGIDYDDDPSAGSKLDGFVRQVQRILFRYEANLTQLTFGDKGSYFTIAFGAPVAHEDDAVRATSAALELQSLWQELEFISSAKIGISQGRMYAGAYGGAKRRTYSLMGDEMNLAARLMQLAEPNRILVSEAAQMASSDKFTWESLPPVKVKGKSEPVKFFSLQGLRERQTIRLQAPKYKLPMVGREEELDLFRQKLEPVQQGRGQIITVTAEAGMGKSRLIAEFIRIAEEHDITGFGGECQSYGTGTSYLVWHNIWRAFFELDTAQPVEAQIKALEAQLTKIKSSLLPRLPLLGAALNLTIPDSELTSSFDARLRKTSLTSLLLDCVRARAKQMPLFFVLEDTHWMDPLSQELLQAIGRAIVDLPVLLVMASRPEGQQALLTSSISHLAHFTEVPLADFSSQESLKLISLKLTQFFGAQADVPQNLVDRVTTRAQGNPFYIEELLNYLQDRNIDPHDNKALAQLDLPSSLHSLILSRIDQLTEHQKSTLKVASVIGRLFRADMLWGVYPQLGTPQRIREDLDVLSQMDLTPMDSPEPELSYLFKHIVTQEVAYESMPYATRANLHDLIGQFVEQTFGETLLEQHVDLLAYHYEHSENEPKKREYLLKAGRAAQSDYANTVAIGYYQRVLPLLPLTERVAVMRNLASVMALVGQWDEAEATRLQALHLAEQLNNRQEQAWCQAELAELFRLQGSYAEASAWLEKATADFEAEEDKAGLSEVLRTAGTVAAQQGDFAKSRSLYQQSLLMARELDNKASIGSVLANLSIVARLQGDATLARAFNEEALEIRRALGDKRLIGASLNNLGNLALDQKEYIEARGYYEEALALMRQVGDTWGIANFLNNLGNAITALQDYGAAHDLYHESLTIYRELGDKWALAYLLEDIGALSAIQGFAKEGLTLIGAASTLREEIGSPNSTAEQAKLDARMEPARKALTEAEQMSAATRGKALAVDQAIEFAFATLTKVDNN